MADILKRDGCYSPITTALTQAYSRQSESSLCPLYQRLAIFSTVICVLKSVRKDDEYALQGKTAYFKGW